MTFFLFHRVLYPIHICLLHNNLYPQSTKLPASVLPTSIFDIYCKLLLFFFIIPHTLSQKASVSSAAVFMLRTCSFFSYVCVMINESQVELHAPCLSQSLEWPVSIQNMVLDCTINCIQRYTSSHYPEIKPEYTNTAILCRRPHLVPVFAQWQKVGGASGARSRRCTHSTNPESVSAVNQDVPPVLSKIM